MKVLFAVNNDAVSDTIAKKYQQMYKEIIVSKNVYYFNAILKELQKDKTYDRVVISEDLEPFTNNNYDIIDNFIFERLDSISDEATSTAGEDIPIILIATDRRNKSDNLLIKLFGIGVYSVLLGQDRSIDEVCRLINKPRTKKEAKVYYKIDSNEVEYRPENDEDVSEQEINNILSHYKRLGKNEDRYVDSFNNIASQYTDEQLRVIIRCLPLNVKAVLEANSPKYQQLISYRTTNSKKVIPGTNKANNSSKAISSNGIKIESIGNSENKMTKPVIIPSAKRVKEVQGIRQVSKDVIEEEPEEFDNPEEFEDVEDIFDEFDDVDTLVQDNDIEEEVKVEPKRGRGRPRKVQTAVEEEVKTEPKRGRGRPKKVQQEEVKIAQEKDEEEDDDEILLPGFDQIDTLDEDEDFENKNIENDNIYEEDDDETLPGFEDYDTEEDEEDEVLPGFEDEEEIEENDEIMQDDEQDYEDSEDNENQFFNFEDDENTSYSNIEEDYNEKEIEPYNRVSTGNLQNLLTGDNKIVAFVGTSKNGTSFLVNNVADLLSKQGIKTAILDLTKNRNAYYIYTKNEEDLRKVAYSCIDNLVQGKAAGIKVNNNLDVYTSLPGENGEIKEYEAILETLVKNYSLVILDCDFKTEYGYLKEAQELYLVQSMDVLTIQPLTAYLRDLKAKQILDQEKIRVVVNKYTKVRGVTEKVIIGGMAFYNDPAMSFMTELFNRETVKYCTIPFDSQVYATYLGELINCSISVNAYPKDFLVALKRLSNMVYPLINGSNNYNKNKYSNPKYNKYATTDTFSNQMNSTLDKMKRNY